MFTDFEQRRAWDCERESACERPCDNEDCGDCYGDDPWTDCEGCRETLKLSELIKTPCEDELLLCADCSAQHVCPVRLTITGPDDLAGMANALNILMKKG